MAAAINSDPAKNSDHYNALTVQMRKLRSQLKQDNVAYALIDEILKTTDEISRVIELLETQRKQDMRNASNEAARAGEVLSTAAGQREKLRHRIAALEMELEALMTQPHGFGTFIRLVGYHEIRAGDETRQFPLVDVADSRGQHGRVLVVNEGLKAENLRYRQTLLLLGVQGPTHVLDALDEFQVVGREAVVSAVLQDAHEGKRLLIAFGDRDEQRVAHVAASVNADALSLGSRILFDPVTDLIIEVLPEKESSRWVVDEVPTVSFDDIGGLAAIVTQIKRELVTPILYPDVYKQMGLSTPRGFMLVGPPGVGKTMTAKAIANYTATEISKKSGVKATGHFISIRGPELLTKWVGQTEEYLRSIFEEARKTASPTAPVVIFFDEMESMFATRGSGISSDVNNTHVAMFTSLMDGLEERGNVIVIGATNREDMIDPAVTRPGRCDFIIRIPRPDAAAATQIFAKYLKPMWGQVNPKYDVPVHTPERKGQPLRDPETSAILRIALHNDPQNVVTYLIERATARMYDTGNPKNRFVELHYEGDPNATFLRYGDFASGAMIANIVERAKKSAINRYVEQGKDLGIVLRDLYDAIEAAFAEIRTPSLLEDMTHWIMMEGKLTRPITRRPVFVRHDPSQADEEEEL